MKEVYTTSDIIKNIEVAQLKEAVSAFRIDDTVKVHNKIKEGNRGGIQTFEGVVTKGQNGGARETFIVRRSSNSVDVKKTWPLYSPGAGNVEVVRKGRVGRAKPNYLRGRVGKATEIKELVK